MNLLDMRTVLLSYIISSAICALVIGSLWAQNRRRSPELGFWLAGFVIQFLAVLLIALSRVLPGVVSILYGTPLILLGTLLLYVGLERYWGKARPQHYNFILLGGFTLVHAYLVFVQPSLQARNTNFSLGLLVFCAQCAWLLLRRVEPETREDTRRVGLVFILFSLVSLVRLFADMVVPQGNDLFQSGLYDTLAVLIYQMLYIGLTFALFLMVTRRLFSALESDISERKRAEEALRKSEEMFNKAFHASPNAILITRASDGTLADVNEGFTALSGYARDEALSSSSVAQRLWADPAGRERCLAELRAQGRVRNWEFAFRTREGALLDCLYSGEMITLGGEPHILSIVRDITERKQAEEAKVEYAARLEREVQERTRQLGEAQDRLVRQERLAVLGQLAGGVGHELRNPLAIIFNAVYYLKLVLPDAGEKIVEYLTIIDNETRTAEKIVADLLDFARPTSADREPVAAADLARRVLERYPAPTGVTVSVQAGADLPPAYADPRQMTQVLGNLVVNACQAMPQGGRLTISATRRGKEMSIAVADTGVGIAPENMARLFDPLFSTRARGIGLGLAVCARLAEANGGRIEAHSEPEVGSTFTLYLPLHQAGE